MFTFRAREETSDSEASSVPLNPGGGHLNRGAGDTWVTSCIPWRLMLGRPSPAHREEGS